MRWRALPGPVDKPRSWTLKFAPERRRGFKDVELYYPHELAPCSAPAR